MQKNILLLYISNNSGHHHTSLAIEKALKLLDSDVKVLNINAFNYTNPILEKVINKTYMGLIRTRPEVWDYLYDNPKIVKNTKRLRDFIHRYNSRPLKELLHDFNPDAVACTQAFPCGMVADFKKTYSYDLPLFGVLTDYAPHSYWIYDNIDGYIVPSEDTGKRLIENGIKKERVNDFGIPIDPKFSQPLDRSSLMKKFNLDPRIPTILIMGGGQGLGPIKHIVNGLDHSHHLRCQIIVVTGINSSLYKYFQKTAGYRKKRILVFPYTDNIDELMEVSSLVITKPGGSTTAEALSKALPMLIVHPLPGQETMNTMYLLRQEVALKAEDWRRVITLVGGLLSESGRLERMRKRAKECSRPYAAVKTAELILSGINDV